jgi:hypothetical protein
MRETHMEGCLQSSLAFGGFVLRGFANSRGVAARIIMLYSNSSVDRSIKIGRHLKQVFEPYRMMFK